MNIQKLIIEDVRCFAGRQEFNICPLTFLVGENSTGKSTALGCFHTFHSFTSARAYGSHLDFNVEPYQMGAFADIARRSTPKKKSFMLGFEFKSENGGEEVKYFLTLTEKEKGSEPIVQEQRFFNSNDQVVLVRDERETGAERRTRLRHNFENFIASTEESGRRTFLVKVREPFSYMSFFENWEYAWPILREGRRNISSLEKEFRECAKRLSEPFRERWNGYSYSFAPIRSKPQRTYDPLKETISPEGGDIPMALMNMFRADEKGWKELKSRLIEFGKASGLFTDIHVRRLGKSVGDPFQLQIKVKGPKVNMIDVGYGVNQLLPILVRMFNAPQRMTFLMQQPEVHLHPRGQAELSSLLVDLVKQRGHKFMIETHSDYMVDRARIEIMKKRISPEDVSLIYLESVGNSVKVHNIAFDEQANFIDAPGSYREFFLKESDKLLGFA